MPAHFGLNRPVDVTRRIEARLLPAVRLHELSWVVFGAAADGDPVARSIIDRQADELVAMARAILGQLRLARLDPVVVLSGGIFAAADEPFERRIEAGIRGLAPRASIVRLDGPPVLGAALLALDRLHAVDARAHTAAVARARSTLGAWQPTG